MTVKNKGMCLTISESDFAKFVKQPFLYTLTNCSAKLTFSVLFVIRLYKGYGSYYKIISS